jgi:glycosyltransferase 2 family protein
MSKGSAWLRFAPWLIGVLALIALIVVVFNLGEIEQFGRLMRRAQPQWLLLAALLQLMTYVSAASVWHQTLAGVGVHRRLLSLVPLSLAKLFTDQAFPSGGLSGTMLLARGLTRRGITPEITTEILLVSLVSYYAAYLLAVLAAIGLLWLDHEVSGWIISLAAAFAVVAVVVPAAALSLRQWTHRTPPGWLGRLPGLAALLQRIGSARTNLLTRVPLVAASLVLQSSVFLLDAATLWVAFLALGQPAPFAVVFIGFVLACVVATMGPIPAGLGTFEATSVGVLRYLGIDIETALTATLLLRGLTFWLPMVPGLFFARRELAGQADAS